MPEGFSNGSVPIATDFKEYPEAITESGCPERGFALATEVVIGAIPLWPTARVAAKKRPRDTPGCRFFNIFVAPHRDDWRMGNDTGVEKLAGPGFSSVSLVLKIR